MPSTLLRRRTFITGTLAATMTLLPLRLTAKSRARRGLTIRRFHGAGLLVREWIRAPDFAALVRRRGVRSTLEQLYTGLYGVRRAPADRLDKLEVAVATGGWPQALRVLLRTSRFQYPGNPMDLLKAGRLRHGRSERHVNVALHRAAQIERLYQAFARRRPSAWELGRDLAALTEVTPPSHQARLIRATAHAQELEPVVVTAPAPSFIDSSFYISGTSVNQNNTALFLQLYNYNLWLQAHPPQPDPALVEEPPPPVLSNPEEAFWGGAAAQKVLGELQQQGLTEAQSLAALTAAGAALGLFGAGTTVATVGMATFVEGLAAGTIGMQIAFTSAGIFVTFTGIGIILAGALLVVVTLTMLDQMQTTAEVVMMPAPSEPEALNQPDADPDAAMPPYEWTETEPTPNSMPEPLPPGPDAGGQLAPAPAPVVEYTEPVCDDYCQTLRWAEQSNQGGSGC